MNDTLLPISESRPPAGTTTPGITIIYDDRAAGFQAKRFSDMLVASLGCLDVGTLTCWRSELIDLPGVAEDMTADAARSEFVILSLRGDRGLSVAMKEWIEGWLALAAGGASSLIALFNPGRSTAAYADSVRCYLRQVASEAGVPFFAHCACVPTNAAEELDEDEERTGPAPHRPVQSASLRCLNGLKSSGRAAWR